MASIENRLAALQEFFNTTHSNKTRFLVEDGGEFYTWQEPIEYLYTHGAFTPDGKRIVSYPHPVEGVDALSMSLYELIDEAIKRGSIEWPQL